MANGCLDTIAFAFYKFHSLQSYLLFVSHYWKFNYSRFIIQNASAASVFIWTRYYTLERFAVIGAAHARQLCCAQQKLWALLIQNTTTLLKPAVFCKKFSRSHNRCSNMVPTAKHSARIMANNCAKNVPATPSHSEWTGSNYYVNAIYYT